MTVFFKFLIFNSGKDTGHDVDLLISHREEGKECGLLQRLISVLEGRDMILQGRWEQSTFSSDEPVAEAMSSNLKSTLDHFEKWIGIMKLDSSVVCPDKNCGLADEEMAKSVHGKYRKTFIDY